MTALLIPEKRISFLINGLALGVKIPPYSLELMLSMNKFIDKMLHCSILNQFSVGGKDLGAAGGVSKILPTSVPIPLMRSSDRCLWFEINEGFYLTAY